MDKYPLELLENPRPLVFLIGKVEAEPDIHTRLVRALEATSAETESPDVPALSYRSVSVDHAFLEKKGDPNSAIASEALASAANLQTQLALGGGGGIAGTGSPNYNALPPASHQPSLQGVLRSNWMHKHHSLLPSVVLFTVTLCVDWSPGEWQRREASLLESFTKLRSSVSQRENAAIIIVGVWTGAGSMDKVAVEERINSLKRLLQIDARTLFLISMREAEAYSPMIRRLAKTVRDMSNSYYASLSKTTKNKEKNAPFLARGSQYEGILVARYSYKQAYYYEIQGSKVQSLRYYRQCFSNLCECVKTCDDSLVVQLKVVAEYANFKIVSLLLHTQSVKDAFAQFRAHLNTFTKRVGGGVKDEKSVSWYHYAWISDQYIVYAQLMDKYNIPEGPDADRSFLYQNAARYAALRQSIFREKQSKSISLSSSSSQIVLAPPIFIGALPQIIDPSLSTSSPASLPPDDMAVWTHLENKEAAANHSQLIISLLSSSLTHLPHTHSRRLCCLNAMLAQQHMTDSNFSQVHEPAFFSPFSLYMCI